MSLPPTKRSNAMRWIPLAVFAAVALLMVAGVWLSRRPDREALPSPLIDKPAPQFALPSLHEPQRTVTLAELRGAPFVLNVWGSWCPECQVEHPVLTKFAERKRVRVIGYNWNDRREDALRWLDHFGNPYWLVVTDTDSRSAIDWGIYGAPETFLVDASGTIRWKHVGPLTDAIVDGELMPALQQIEGSP